MRFRDATTRAFTLIEVMVVVIVLGIVAAVVIPRFVGATEDAATSSAYYELQKIRKAMDLYMARNGGLPPPVTTGYGTWGGLTSGGYLKSNPLNRYIPKTNDGRIYAGADAAPDTVYQTEYGWIYNTSTRQVWAGGFGADDKPLPKP